MSVIFYPWSSPFCDDGLGFGMGSTNGVVNKYMYRGFQRPGLKEWPKLARDAMDLRYCRGPYTCHFDPEYDVRTGRSTSQMSTLFPFNTIPKKRNYLSFILIFVVVIIFARMLWL